MNIDMFNFCPSCRTFPPKEYKWNPPPFNVAFQFCEYDYEQALRVLSWSALLKKQSNTIHLITDDNFSCDKAIEIAEKSWGKCYVHKIIPLLSRKTNLLSKINSKSRNSKWPASNNHVFAETCKIMREFSSPWLLWETDMIPSQINWLQRLEDEYLKAKRPFMGSWMDCYDIINGGAVYPADVISWSPDFFSNSPEKQIAYDCVIAPDIIWFSHPINHLMPNIFNSRPNGRPGGLIPNVTNWSREMFNWIHNHNTCLIHRDKKGQIIPFLMKKLNIKYSENFEKEFFTFFQNS
jgi:hypothetical protein